MRFCHPSRVADGAGDAGDAILGQEDEPRRAGLEVVYQLPADAVQFAEVFRRLARVRSDPLDA